MHIMFFMTHMTQVFTKRLGHSHHKIVSAEWQRTFLSVRRNFSTFDVIVHSGLAASELNKLIQLRSQKVAGIIPK